MYQVNLQWKEFNVDLKALDESLRASYPNYKGNQAHSVLELWFDEEPSQEDKDAIEALWAALDPDDAMVESYKSAAQLKAASDAKRESGRAKLAALGLSEDELKALLG